MKQAHALKVAEVVPQGSDAVLLRFFPSEAQRSHFAFKPGQYLTLEGGPENDRQWRCYSITSDPNEAHVSVLVRRVQGGLVSNWVGDQVRAGNVLKVFPPAGSFVLRHPDQALLLFAGGSGIAPIFSLARQALASGAPAVALFNANRNRDTAMLMSELAALQARYVGRLHIKFWYDEVDGLPTESDVVQFAKLVGSGDAYLCGPDPFMQLVRKSLINDGRDTGQIFCEEFVQAAESETEESAAVSTLTVMLKGQAHQVSVRAKQTMLAAMMHAKLPVPHACNVGECASCMCRLESGSVERLSNSVLDEDDEASGWLLACRTYATGDAVSVRFP